MSISTKSRRPSAKNTDYAPYVRNSIHMPHRVTTTAEDYTFLSSSAAGLVNVSIYGGENLTDVTAYQSKASASTVTATDIICNRIWNALHGTTQAERVGVSYDQNPAGLTEMESSFQYMRVKYIDMTFEFIPQGSLQHPVVFYIMFYRPDEGLPTFAVGNTTSAAHTDMQLVPHMRQVTWYPNAGDIDYRKTTKKTIRIDVRKFYNDLEWSFDPVTAGNFWVAKSGSLYTAEPTADILCRVYAKTLDPDEQGTVHSINVGLHCKWTMEFDRGDQVLPDGAT